MFAELVGNAPGGAGGIPIAILAQGLLFLMTAMLVGVGFGAAILISAPGIVLYLLLPAIFKARESARSTQCMSNLRQLGLGIIRYVDANGVYPPYRLEDPAAVNAYGVVRPRWQWIVSDFVGPYVAATPPPSGTRASPLARAMARSRLEAWPPDDRTWYRASSP